MMRLRTLTILVVVLSLAGCSKEESPVRPTLAAEATVQAAFPDITHIAPEEAASELDSQAEDRPLLLDVRGTSEYNVSHLLGAVRVEPGLEDLTPLDSLAKDREIILYCATGWRSSTLARRLESEGFTNVRNISGSIFRWTNEGRPVYRDGEEVHDVHPVSPRFEPMLDPLMVTYTPRGQ
jgi:rhodanese-related sulfurtransferase